jgi:hypothetical protein
MVSMNIGLEQSVTMRLNSTNDRVEGITLELEPERGHGFYVADVNADGIPDTKRLKDGSHTQLFYAGDFVDCTVEDGHHYILRGGQRSRAEFVNGRWRITEASVNP